MRAFLSILFVGFLVGAYLSLDGEAEQEPHKTGQFDRYFETPAEAVDITSDLLKTQKWSVLATYYDLSQSGVDRDQLTNGPIFLDALPAQTPALTGPGRYKQPFVPGFQFQSARNLAHDVVEVTVTGETGPGEGETTAPQLNTFLLKAHPQGYQLLPKAEATSHLPSQKKTG